MVQAAEIRSRVLSILEEFHHENIFAMLNTVLKPTGSAEEVDQYALALQSLLRDSLVTLFMWGGNPADPREVPSADADTLLRGMHDWFRFDTATARWTLKTGDIKKSRIPAIRVTPRGTEEAIKVLDKRGYRWWTGGRG